MEPQRYRKRPVEVLALPWLGDNAEQINEWTGGKFRVIPRHERVEPAISGEIYDVLHCTWVGVREGQKIIKGVRQEFYPCDPDVFAATYELVEEF